MRTDDVVLPLKIWTRAQIFYQVNLALKPAWQAEDWQQGRTVWFKGEVLKADLQRVRVAYLDAGWRQVYVIQSAGIYGLEVWM